ncbi:hypothetical protein [Vibrio sp. Vb2880]|uniref:hypothetical protein n=1 Tax=Vibrio sp. Vb2880 TaxID=2816076 RepID=UPI00398CFE87
MTAFLVLSITPLTITAIFFLQSHSKDLQEQSTSHLLSVRDTKQQQIIDYFEARETEVMGFVRSELAYASGGRFYGLVNAFSRLGNDIEESRKNAQQRYIEGSGDQIKTSTLPESSNYVGSERYRLLHKRYHWPTWSSSSALILMTFYWSTSMVTSPTRSTKTITTERTCYQAPTKTRHLAKLSSVSPMM